MARILLGSPFATIATLALFWMMAALVQNRFEPPPPQGERPVIEIFRTIVEPDTYVEPPPRVRPQTEVQPPPPMVDRLERGDIDTGLLPGPVLPDPDFDPSLAPGTAHLAPLVRIPPRYPGRALSRGVEGYAVVEFDIAADGSVANATVVEADPSGYWFSDKVYQPYRLKRRESRENKPNSRVRRIPFGRVYGAYL